MFSSVHLFALCFLIIGTLRQGRDMRTYAVYTSTSMDKGMTEWNTIKPYKSLIIVVK